LDLDINCAVPQAMWRSRSIARAESVEERSERLTDGGRRRTETAVYIAVHGDLEHRRTPSGAHAV